MTISKQASLVSQQIPEFIRTEYPVFVAFLEAYYEYLDQNTITRKLTSAKDIDETLDLFIDSFKKDFTSNIPDMQHLSTKDFLRNAKAFYAARGTEASYKFLFRAMYGKEISVYYPETAILRASDGRWSQEYSVIVTAVSGDPFACVGQRITINTGTSSSVRLVKRVKFLNGNYYEIFIENMGFLAVSAGSTVVHDNFNGVVGHVIDKVVVTKPGAGFRVGQIFNINDSHGVGAKIRVTRVDSNGGILFAKPVTFGYGYSGSTYYGRLISKFNVASVNPINTQTDQTAGTSESGVVFTYGYSAEYSSGYEGAVLSSFFAQNTTSETQTFDDVNAANIEVRFGALAKYPGFYTTSNGFLSNTMKLQDNYYYQIYSYVLKLDEQLFTYKNLVKALLHPAGMEMFGEYELTMVGNLQATIDLLDKLLSVNFLDIAYTNDSNTFDMLKGIIDTLSVDDAKYMSMLKGFSDSVTLSDSGTVSITVPGNYDNYPTESYFDPASYYTVGTTTVISSW